MPLISGNRRFAAGFSLHGRLALLVVATVLPLLAFSLTETYLRYDAERESFGERTLDLARSIARALEASHQMRVAALQALALSPALQAGDIEAFRATALEFIATKSPHSTLGIADQTGQLLFAVGDVPEGAVLPKRHNMATQEQVFRTGKPATSDLFKSAINEHQTYTVEVPVFRNGGVAYVLALDPTTVPLTELTSQHGVEEGWAVAIMDSHGIIAARRPYSEKLIGHSVSRSLLQLLQARSEGVAELISLEGIPVLTAFSHTELSGWSVAIGVPRSQFSAPLRHRVFTILGVTALILLVSLGLAASLAHRITRPIKLLARFASQAGHRSGPIAPARLTGLREVDEVGRVIATTTTSLHALADTLEQRVQTEVAERVRTEQALRQSQKMEAVGQLTAGVAHDFNNLLQAQMAGLELLLDAVRGQERPTRYVQMALASSEKGARLTHSLLSFSRQQMLRPEAVDTPALLTRLRGLLSRTLDPRIALRLKVEPGLAPPLADLAQLEAALLNLCLNGRDAMADRGGLLVVEASSGADCVSSVRLPDGLKAEHCIVFAVTDEGSGIDAGTLARVCEPFFTTKGVGKGSGLGLSMVQGFARQSGGELLIESWPGAGTRVAIWLPRATLGEAGQGRKDRPDDAGLRYEEAGSRPQGSGRVLLVDDEASVRELMAEVLEGAGFDVVQASSGEEGLALLRVPTARFDALVTDYAMPGMTGGELMAAIRRERPRFPGLVITGYAETAQLGEVPSGCRVLHKPFRTNDLVAGVVELLESSHALASLVW